MGPKERLVHPEKYIYVAEVTDCDDLPPLDEISIKTDRSAAEKEDLLKMDLKN